MKNNDNDNKSDDNDIIRKNFIKMHADWVLKPFIYDVVFIISSSTYIETQLFLGNTPHVILGTRRPISPISEFGAGLIWWSIHFDRVVRNTIFFPLEEWPVFKSFIGKFKVKVYYLNITPDSQY